MTRDTFDLFTPPERGRFGDNEQAERSSQRVNGSSDLIDVALILHWQSKPEAPEKGALLVSADGNETRAIWVPTKFCEIEKSGRFVPGIKKSGQKAQLEVITLTLPQWVAREKGLI